jgi:hypothetical protein
MWIYTTKGKIMMLVSGFLIVLTCLLLALWLFFSDEYIFFYSFTVMLFLCFSILYSAFFVDIIEWKDKKGD